MSDQLIFKYFPLRGRGEVIRLLFALKNINYIEKPIDYADMKSKSGTKEFPFGQAPILVSSNLHIAQMDCILRFLGREYNLYGNNNSEKVIIDMILGGVESIRSAYTNLIYQDKLSKEAKEKYLQLHFNNESITIRNGGAHFKYLENFLERSSTEWVVNDQISIADIQLFDIVDLHLREAAFPQDIKDKFPLLVKHHNKFASESSIANYLSSDKRPSKINGSDLG